MKEHNLFIKFKGEGRNLCILLMITLAFFLISCSKSVSSDLEVKIESIDSIPNNQYVNVSLTIQNKCDTSIVLYGFNGKIQPSMGGFLYFDIVKDDKDTLVCHPAGPIPKYPHEKDTLILRPSEIHSEVVNLTSFYTSSNSDDKPEWDSTSIWGTRKWENGEYTIQCRYTYSHQPGYKGGRDLWQGSTISNIIKINLDE